MVKGDQNMSLETESVEKRDKLTGCLDFKVIIVGLIRLLAQNKKLDTEIHQHPQNILLKIYLVEVLHLFKDQRDVKSIFSVVVYSTSETLHYSQINNRVQYAIYFSEFGPIIATHENYAISVEEFIFLMSNSHNKEIIDHTHIPKKTIRLVNEPNPTDDSPISNIVHLNFSAKERPVKRG